MDAVDDTKPAPDRSALLLPDGRINFETPGLHFVFALQGGGKSHLLRYLMYMTRKHYDFGIVFSNTGFITTNFEYIADRSFIHLKYSDEVLCELMRIMRERKEAGKPVKTFVIFDDCIAKPQWHSPHLQALCTQVRHYDCTVIITTQHVTNVLPIFRGNAWKVFMFQTMAKATLNALYEGYGQLFESPEDFKAFYKKGTGGKHQFVMYDARASSTVIAERYLVARCPADIPAFSLGPKPSTR